MCACVYVLTRVCPFLSPCNDAWCNMLPYLEIGMNIMFGGCTYVRACISSLVCTDRDVYRIRCVYTCVHRNQMGC